MWWGNLARPLVGGGLPESWLARQTKARIYASVSPQEERGFTRLTPQNYNGWENIFREPVQSFEWYHWSQPMRPTEARRVIVLQPIGPMNARQQRLLSAVSAHCAAWFQMPARIASPLPLNFAPLPTRGASGAAQGTDEFWMQPALRKQYNAVSIIRAMQAHLPPDAVAYLGVTMADLWAHDLGFVFGVGNFRGRCGVYSFARYFPEFWGRERTAGDDGLVLRRACQVLDHEAGHLLGLEHCVLYKCVMNGSNSLADADATPLEPCPICLRKLAWNIGFVRTQRQRDLLNFYRAYHLPNH